MCSIGLHCRQWSPFQWNTFAIKGIDGPAPVLVAALDHDFDGLTNAAVGLDSRIPQIVEAPQDVVVPERRKREAEPAFVDDFAGSKRAEHAALVQIVFASLAGLRDSRQFRPARSYASSPSSTRCWYGTKSAGLADVLLKVQPPRSSSRHLGAAGAEVDATVRRSVF